MKKFLVCTLTMFIVGIMIVISLRDSMVPVDDILGCYNSTIKTHIDRVCLYSDGRYEQFYIKEGSTPQKYNSNNWRSFTHSNDLGDFVVASLNEFIIVDIDGEFQEFKNVDIQPHRDFFGSVLFTRGINSSGYFREYYRE